MKSVLAVLLAAAAVSAPRPAQTFTGTISDDMCALAGHASMRMGPTDPECTRACIRLHGASYVLVDGKTVFVLSDQKLPDQFAGQKVRVVGTLDEKTKTIKVDSIAAAQ